MNRFTDWVLGHRTLIALAWLVVAVAGGALAPTTVDRLGYDFALPGQPAYEANQVIEKTYGGGGAIDPLLLVARGQGAETQVSDLATRAAAAVPGTRIVTAADPGAASLTVDDGRLSTAVLYPPVTPGADPYAEAQPRLQALADQAKADGTDVELTGFLLLAEGGGGEPKRGEGQAD